MALDNRVKLHLRCTQGFQIDHTAHPAVKNKGDLGNTKPTPERGQQPLQGFVTRPVAAQHLQMQGNPFGVGGHGQQNLWAIGTMVAAVSIAAELGRAFAFKIHAAQIIKNQADPLRKGIAIETFFQGHPLTVEQIHGLVEIILVEGFVGRQATGLGQSGAFGLFGQGQLGAGKEEPGEHHRLE